MRETPRIRGPRGADRTKHAQCKFVIVNPGEVPDLPETVPGQVIGQEEDVVVAEWYKEVANPELDGVFRPKPCGDIVFWCTKCRVWRSYARSCSTRIPSGVCMLRPAGNTSLISPALAVLSVTDSRPQRTEAGQSDSDTCIDYASPGRMCEQPTAMPGSPLSPGSLPVAGTPL